MTTSTPVSEMKSNWNATKTTSQSQLPTILLKNPAQMVSVETGGLPFTGNENPFVPRGALIPVITTDLNQKWQENESSDGSVMPECAKLNSCPKEWSILKFQPAGSASKVSQTALVQPSVKMNKPLRSILAKNFKEQPNNFRMSGLQPVSPRSQTRMELEAGMRPSLPSQQQAKQFNGNPTLQFPNGNNAERPVRPILGRKFNESQTPASVHTPFLKTYEDFCAGIQRKLQPAHSNHKLATLAADDFAIIFAEKAPCGNIQPIDLSKKARGDYAKVWNEMATKAHNTKELNVAPPMVEAGTSPTTSATPKRTPPFTGKEKPFFPRNMTPAMQSVAERSKDNDLLLPAPVTNSTERLRKEAVGSSARMRGEMESSIGNEKSDNNDNGATVKEIIAPVHTRNIFEAFEKDCTDSEEHKIPIKETKTNFLENEILPTTTDKLEGKLIIDASISSTSTVPYEEDSCEPLDLSRVVAKDSEQADTCAACNNTEGEDTEETPKTCESSSSLDVRGHAINSTCDDHAQELLPVETSDGLMDSIFEEDMVKGDSKLDEMSGASVSELLKPSFRLYGNNIWQHPTGHDSEKDSYVSDSEEEGYLTCNTSLGYDTTRTMSPVIEFPTTNVYTPICSMNNTPSKVMKYLKQCNFSGLKKGAICSIVDGMADTTSTVNGQDLEDEKYKRVVLKGIQHMLITSIKMESILNFTTKEISDKVLYAKIDSVVKSYKKQTLRCINKLGRTLQDELTESGASATKSRSVKSPANSAKMSQQKTKTVKFGKDRSKVDCRTKKTPLKVKIKVTPRTCKVSRTEHENSTGKSIPKDEERVDYPVATSTGAVDLVTSTPIDGNRYWKKRMLRQNFSSSGAGNTQKSLQKAIRKNTEEKLPECKKGLLSASFSDDDDVTTDPKPKLTWTPCTKFQPCLKLNKIEETDKSFSYRKLKECKETSKNKKPAKAAKKNTKRKRSKGSPSTVSPTSRQTPKKTKNEVSGNCSGSVTSSHRRHFPYQNVSKRNVSLHLVPVIKSSVKTSTRIHEADFPAPSIAL